MQQDRRFSKPITDTMVALLVVLTVVASLGGIGSAEPGEDGAHPDPAGYYASQPLSGWMTERSGDRIHDFAQIGNTVYVAGTFSGIRPSTSGPVTWQANLAAFDATTGVHLAAFDPSVNGTVYSLAVAPDGSRLYAGGTFTTVDGGDHRRLAALDPTTGSPVAAFDADVSGGSVRSVVARGNDVYVGGNFSSIEGVSRTRLARVVAATGAVDPGWAPSANGNAVLTLEVPTDGSRVYVGGRFSNINGAANSAELAAVSPVNGAVDPTFAAQPGREVFDLVATDDGRLYVAEGGPLGRAEAYDNAGVLLARWDTNGDVQAVEQIGALVYFGGHDFGPEEEENVAVVDPDDLSLFDVEPFKPPVGGGDGVWAFHATAEELWLGGQSSGPYRGFGRYSPTAPPPPREDLISSGSGWSYLDDGSDQGTAWRANGFDDSGWPFGSAQLGFGDGDETTVLSSGHVSYWFRREFPVVEASALSDLRFSMVVDDGAVAYLNGTEIARHNMPAGPITASTLASTTAFGPAESSFTTFDVPASLVVDGTNTLAVEVHQASVGSSDVSFDGRLTAVGTTPDTTPPTVPNGLQWTALTDTSFTLLWNPSTDDRAVDHYEVFRDGTSVGTTATTSLSLTGLTPATTYAMTVEAVDGAGNRSGPSFPFNVTTNDPAPGNTELIPTGSTWRYLDDGSNQGTAWRQIGFNDSTWAAGPAELGRGDGDEVTVLAGGPVTYWMRRSFSVASAASITALDLQLLADDGAVVYLNGVEVARDNMPSGPIVASTNAVDYRFGDAESTFNGFNLATAPLVDGTNVLAVEVHQAPGSSDASFDAALVATGGLADSEPPSVPTGLSAGTVTHSTVPLTWAASNDNVGVDHYDLFANGALVGSALGTSGTITGLTASTAYAIEVEAVDGAGNRSGRSAALPVTTADAPGGGPVTFIPQSSTWRYQDAGGNPVGWTAPGFDDSTWSNGAAELGFGDGDETTVIAGGQITYRFRASFAVTAAATVSSLTASMLADDGAVVYINGVEVVRDNMPAGPIGPNTLASTYRFGSAERAFRSFVLPPSVLVDGNNTIAVEVHQANAGSSDLGFNLSLDGIQ